MNFLSFGNRKLPKSTAIFNMTSAINCPSDNAGLCAIADICYARKTEHRWPNTYFYRERQTEFFDKENWNRIAEGMLAVFSAQKQPVKMLRFSESGDFRTQRDVVKFGFIARKLVENGFKVYGYTARKDLDFSELKKWATVNGQGFKVTNQIDVVDEFSGRNGVIKCIGSCHECSACANARNKIIEIKKH